MTRGTLLVVLSFVAHLAGCGDSGLASAGNQDAGSDASIGTRPADCPSAAPTLGGSCSREGLLCEYGDDFNPLCNMVSVCSSGKWASPVFHGGATCPTKGPVVGPNPAECAATRATVPVGQACSSTSTCAYDGALCTCEAFCPSFPVAQRDCDADAGVTQNCCDRTKVVWHCNDGPAYCARPRPRVGTPCSAGARCAVDPPSECGQTQLECQAGQWNVALNECPISTANAKQDIAYLDPAAAERLRAALMQVRLAVYRYRNGDDAQHLGFLIDDMPVGSPAVLPTRDRVDLYGYVSMAVASLQHQEREIAVLKGEVARLAGENAAMKRAVQRKRGAIGLTPLERAP